MANGIHRPGLYMLGIPFAVAPIAVALLRAYRSNYDLTMLWMAFAAFAGAAAVMSLGRARQQSPRTVLALSAVAFVCSTLCAFLAGRLLGMTSVPGVLAVAVAFGLSWAIGHALDTLARVAG
jgi:hypothetical protein